MKVFLENDPGHEKALDDHLDQLEAKAAEAAEAGDGKKVAAKSAATAEGSKAAG